MLSAVSKSFFTILPPGPDPFILFKSTPLDFAIFFARGDALILFPSEFSVGVDSFVSPPLGSGSSGLLLSFESESSFGDDCSPEAGFSGTSSPSY